MFVVVTTLYHIFEQLPILFGSYHFNTYRNRKIFRNIYSFVRDARRIKKEYRKTVEPRNLNKPKVSLSNTALKVPDRFRFPASDPLRTSMRIEFYFVFFHPFFRANNPKKHQNNPQT